MIDTLIFKDLPFKPDNHTIIYVENEYDEEVNRYIQDNYETIKTSLKGSGYQFVYIPFFVNELTQKGVLPYYAPYLDLTENKSRLTSSWLLEYLDNPADKAAFQPSLVYWSASDYAQVLAIHDYDYTRTNDFNELFRHIIVRYCRKDNKLGNEPTEEAERKHRERCRKNHSFFNRFKKGLDNLSGELFGTKGTNDDRFSVESRELLEDVIYKIDLLRQRGFSQAMLEAIIHQEEKLSRLVITKDYDIYLPDYHNMEIKMAPLSKAVFFLFLRHPEGIIFKHLPDYHDELLGIYSQLKDGMISPAHRKSIDDITNPFNNSINEKCARIREAFVSKFDERLANHYCVDGPRGEAKKIDLPRDLVTWQ
ncbi:MAG: hypothetical protein IJV42_05295 [Bacteroidaceae bacterium]|nr:hypothetical protein [Bacteroidaceae bacterium]